MPTTSAKATKQPNTRKATPAKVGETAGLAPTVDAFPFAQYASVLGVHLILVGFVALYLPQTTRLFAPLAARKTDRPQSEFMERLTAEPSTTLSWICVGLVLLEVWWASWMRTWSFVQTARWTEVEIKLDRVRFDGLRFTKMKDATVITLCATLATYVVVVAFGAPITTHIVQTALFAFVVAIMTAFTPAFVLAAPSFASDTSSLVNRLTWTRLFAELSPKSAVERAMVYPAVGTFVGGWVGAIPIALDWDRPWQSWPLTPLFGSLGGYIIGAVLAFAVSTTKYLAVENIASQPSKAKSS